MLPLDSGRYLSHYIISQAHKHAQRGHETFGQETHKCLGTFVHKHITSGPQDSEGISQGKQAQFLKPTMYMAGSPNLHWGTSTPVGSRTTKYIGGRASSLSPPRARTPPRCKYMYNFCRSPSIASWGTWLRENEAWCCTPKTSVRAPAWTMLGICGSLGRTLAGANALRVLDHDPLGHQGVRRGGGEIVQESPL